MGLYYDPFADKIFDYTNAMEDLRSSKLRTIVPAQQSFTEDRAKILRGIRIAARLRLSPSEEIEAAIRNLSSLVAQISKPRLMMEVNYMLSYGAAAISIQLLKKFKLLEMLLPFQAAYLSAQLKSQTDLFSLMLMKLFFQLDQLITCDHPCHATLWISLLSFHMALFSNPQPAEVLLTFASLLSHGKWDESVQFARQHAAGSRKFVPEILTDPLTLSDDEIAEMVTLLCEQAQKSIYILTKEDCLKKAMARFRNCPSSDLIFISHKQGGQAWDVFEGLQNDATSGVEGRKGSMLINYSKLGKGDIAQVRFVLGQIIIDALASSNSAKSELAKHKLRKNHLEIENADKRSRSPSNNGRPIIDALASSDSAKSKLKKHKLRKDESELENADKRSKSPSNGRTMIDALASSDSAKSKLKKHKLRKDDSELENADSSK